MSNLPLFLAALDFEEINAPWRTPSGSAKAIFIVLGAIALITSLLLVWAAFFRKRRRRHSHHHQHHHSSERAPNPAANAAESVLKPHKRRRRRRHREHRPRNPTLAETGGLPPVRTEKPTEPLP